MSSNNGLPIDADVSELSTHDEVSRHRSRLRDIVAGYRLSQLVHAAVRIGLIEQLAAGPRTLGQLASGCDAQPDILDRVVATLAELQVLRTAPDGTVALGPLGTLLRRDAPGSLAAWTETVCAEQYLAWAELVRTIRSGEPGFAAATGVNFWDHLERDDAARAAYAAGMAESAREARELLVRSGRLEEARSMVDVGGGDAAVAVDLLRAHPRLRAVVLDRAGVAERARHRIARAGLGDRATFVTGDFLTDSPPRGDVHVLCRVLSDWPDEPAVRILANCRRAMTPTGRLLVVGGLVDRADPTARGLLDLHLRVVTGGRERTLGELRSLLGQAQMETRTVIHSTDGRMSIVEAVLP